MKQSFLITILLCGICLAAQPASSTLVPLQTASAEALKLTPEEIARLINECGERTTRMSGRLYNYTFLQTETEYEVDKKGLPKGEQSRVYEVFPTLIGNRHRLIYVQVSENGAPLSPEKLARERERAAKQTQEIEQAAAAAPTSQPSTSTRRTFYSEGIRVEKRGGMSRTVWYISPTDFLVSHDFSGPERVRFRDREAILLSFRPRPSYVYDKSNVSFPDGVKDYGAVMSQLGGRIWIDALDKVILRLEAKPVRELQTGVEAGPDPKAPLWFELIRLPNGTWAPSQSKYDSRGREDVFWKTTISRSRRYSDFKLFKTTADVEKIEAPPAKP